MVDQSKILIEFSVKNVNQLVLDIRVKNYNEECSLFNDDIPLADLLELSIVKHIIVVQGGTFSVWRQAQFFFFLIVFPVNVVDDKDNFNE